MFKWSKFTVIAPVALGLGACGTFEIPHTSPTGDYVNGALLKLPQEVDGFLGVIVDVRPQSEYDLAHIPGAINIVSSSWPDILTPEQVPDLATRLGEMGLDEQDDLLIVGEGETGWGSDGRLFWMLEFMGHSGQLSLLNGGFDAWSAQASFVETSPNLLEASTYLAAVDHSVYASTEDVAQLIGDSSAQIIDTRSLSEYSEGHIEGALWYEWSQSLNVDGTLRNGQDLEEELTSSGIDLSKRTVTYCQSGYRSAHFYFVGRLLGLNPLQNYDGSWETWSAKEY